MAVRGPWDRGVWGPPVVHGANGNSRGTRPWGLGIGARDRGLWGRLEDRGFGKWRLEGHGIVGFGAGGLWVLANGGSRGHRTVGFGALTSESKN